MVIAPWRKREKSKILAPWRSKGLDPELLLLSASRPSAVQGLLAALAALDKMACLVLDDCRRRIGRMRVI